MKAEAYIKKNEITNKIAILKKEAWVMSAVTILMMALTIASIATLDLKLVTLAFVVSFIPVICQCLVRGRIDELEEQIFQLRIK